MRSRSRSWALNLLYAWELTGEGSPVDFAATALERRRMSPRYRPYVRLLLETIHRELDEIDALITRHTSNWRIERLDVIDRNVLRIGVAELRFVEDVPPKVAIHEALQLATKYGSEESTRFVNGVLDAVFRDAELEE